MEQLGDRLRAAIARRGSIRSFQRDIEKRLKSRGVRGYTYPSINAYLKGDVMPSRDFLEAAADLLGVRAKWLETGEGHYDPVEQDFARERELQAARAPDARKLARDRIAERYPTFRLFGPAEQDVFLSLLYAFVQSAPDARELVKTKEWQDEVLKSAGDLLWYLFLPLRNWGFVPYATKEEAGQVRFRGQQSRLFALALMAVLRSIVRETGRGSPIAEATTSPLRQSREAHPWVAEEVLGAKP